MYKQKDFYYKKNRIAQLRGLCAVFQSDYSITNAATKTHIARSALSKQISALERDLGIQLFDRSEYRTIKPTKEGILFYKEAVQHMNGIDGLFENFNEHLKKFNNSHLNIALHQMAITYIFPPILEKMLKIEEFKNLEMNIHNLSKEEAMKKLIDKEVDIAFCILNSRDKIPVEIESVKSIQSHAYVIFNKSHPLAKKDIITTDDIEKYEFLRRNTEIKTLSNFNIKTGSIAINGILPTESVIEIIKHTDNLAIVSNGNDCLNSLDIVAKDIEHLINDKAFFQIMTLKNRTLTKPMMWLINELKKLK